MAGLTDNDDAPAIEHVENVFREVLAELENEYGFQAALPELRYASREEIQERNEKFINPMKNAPQVDPEAYTILIPEHLPGEKDGDVLRDHADAAFHRLFNRRVTELAVRSANTLVRRYDSFNPDLDFASIYVDDMDKIATYGPEGDEESRRRPEIVFDYTVLDSIDLETGEEVIPPKSPENLFSHDRIDALSDHEVAHGVSFQNNPNALTLNRAGNQKEAEDEYDVLIASLEAISNYEQILTRYGEELYPSTYFLKQGGVLKAFERQMQPDPDSGRLYDDPYDLGELAAFHIEAGFQQDHPHEEARRLTRDYLLNVITTPEGLEGAIERSLEKRGLPNYHEIFQERYNALRNAENPQERALSLARERRSEMDDNTPKDEVHEARWDIHAIKHAYEVVAEEPAPDDLSLLFNSTSYA